MHTARRDTFAVLPNGTRVDAITVMGDGGITMSVMTYGCTILAVNAPDRDGRYANVVLRYARLEQYIAERSYYGAVAGRYANRIANARFCIDGRWSDLNANEPPNHLHGGFRGFDKHVWDAETDGGGRGVTFRRVSPAGEEGYPGELAVQVSYLLDRNQLLVRYDAETDAPTHVNLTQHSYFNLRGDGLGDVLDHRLELNAHAYLPVDNCLIPTGAIAPVAATAFDFTAPSAIGARMSGNYDHNFVLTERRNGTAWAARLSDPSSGRTLEVRTTEPGLQVYSGGDHRGVCLETQHYPDSPNRPGFPPTLLRPGQRYQSTTEFAFGIG